MEESVNHGKLDITLDGKTASADGPHVQKSKYERIELPGYIVDEALIRNLDAKSLELLTGELSFTKADDSVESVTSTAVYWLKLTNQSELRFKELNALINELATYSKSVESITLEYRSSSGSRLRIALSDEGHVELRLLTRTSSLEFDLERVRSVLSSSSEEPNWLVRSAVFSRGTRLRTIRIAFLLLLISSISLTVATYSYYLAKSIGVNLDPKLIPKGNEYLRQVADALKSDDLRVKLDALLSSELQGFINVSDYLSTNYNVIMWALFGIGLAVAVLLSIRLLSRLYPRALFLFGNQRNRLQHLQTKRQIWGIGVCLAFAVNVIAGLVVTMMMR